MSGPAIIFQELPKVPFKKSTLGKSPSLSCIRVTVDVGNGYIYNLSLEIGSHCKRRFNLREVGTSEYSTRGLISCNASVSFSFHTFLMPKFQEYRLPSLNLKNKGKSVKILH